LYSIVKTIDRRKTLNLDNWKEHDPFTEICHEYGCYLEGPAEKKKEVEN